MPLAVAQRVVDRIVGAQLVLIEDAGHCTPVEAPDAVSDAL